MGVRTSGGTRESTQLKRQQSGSNNQGSSGPKYQNMYNQNSFQNQNPMIPTHPNRTLKTSQGDRVAGKTRNIQDATQTQQFFRNSQNINIKKINGGPTAPNSRVNQSL